MIRRHCRPERRALLSPPPDVAHRLFLEPRRAAIPDVVLQENRESQNTLALFAAISENSRRVNPTGCICYYSPRHSLNSEGNEVSLTHSEETWSSYSIMSKSCSTTSLIALGLHRFVFPYLFLPRNYIRTDARRVCARSSTSEGASR